MKPLTFIILALLVVANTKNMLISASRTSQGSIPNALFLLILQHHLTLLIAQGLEVKSVWLRSLRKLLKTIDTPDLRRDANYIVNKLFLLSCRSAFVITINYSEIESLFLIKKEINPLCICNVMSYVFFVCIFCCFVIDALLSQSSRKQFV